MTRADPMTLYSFFSEAAPDGVNVERPPSEGATKALNLNVDLTINIDVAKTPPKRRHYGFSRVSEAKVEEQWMPA
jgi:hypothetical protein